MAQSNTIQVKIFYTWGKNSLRVYDPGFGRERSWDIDLLKGHEHVFVRNTSCDPGSHHYKGIINPDLIPQINFYNPDAIIVYGWNFNSHLKVIRYFKGKIPILFRGDSTLLDKPEGFSIKKMLRKIVLKWVYRNVDFVLSPGTASDKYFEWAGLKSKQIVRVPHAVDNSRFSGEIGHDDATMKSEAKKWKEKLGIDASKKVILFVGKFEQKKDPLILVRAFKKLLPKYDDIHLVMVGDGILKTEIEKALHFNLYQLKMDDCQPKTQNQLPYTILPFQNQSVMPIVYRLGDLFVMPSGGPKETWGLAINEAMACGKPVLVSNKCGGAFDLVENSKNGYVFEAGNEWDLIEKIESMLKIDLEKMGIYSQHKIKSFGYDSFLFGIEKLLT